jgi:hypothetical protein
MGADPAVKERRMCCNGTNNWGACYNPKFDEYMAEGDKVTDTAQCHESYQQYQMSI